MKLADSSLLFLGAVWVSLFSLILLIDPTKFVHGYPGSTLESHISLLVNGILSNGYHLNSSLWISVCSI
ncbi:hypothetical protein LINPERPRIM_LOCUS13344 [Linum perenne]